MRRSGSHFAMMRTLGSIKLEELEYGLHFNSIGISKLRSNFSMCNRGQNYCYTSEKRVPRTQGDKYLRELNEATNYYMDGKPEKTKYKLKFLAINIEDISVDEMMYHSRQVASRLEGFEVIPSCFVILRALRSVALSREAYVVRRPKSFMKHLFEELKIEVWDDHCYACENGESVQGIKAVPLHYWRGSETGGQSFLEKFRPNACIETYKTVPSWLSEYVPMDAAGSSLCGGGHGKESEVRASVRARKPSLKKFEHLFEKSLFAREHALKHGEA